ncbi:LacI family DNA-binding transcriptional regulator [Bifidobacterium sp. 82T10]|uniref:LacI family DNA-binding transcriptional regulator n=1 Tax=Bifidobacterium miconis TaxID=2834435 RepID=A0ABS6WD36_9BIFI|nr:LacI family DNA-binding transcriptional regulator [Bifidobacterium miconis]MBW3091963.1 LacI family DNA-binding transcriptional regulator [Bifidobacterium miconis]
MVTFKDVAKEAGVSPATVSYALRGGEHVSKHTMDKVVAAAQKLGYVANPSARSLRRGRTNVIDIVVHELDVPYFYSRLSDVASDVIREAGYQAVVLKTGMDTDNVSAAVSSISNQYCDGVILNPSGLPAQEIKRLSVNRPVVLLDEAHAKPVLDTVMTPNEEGVTAATRHMIERGCRNLLFVGGGRAELDSYAEGSRDTGPARTHAFRQTLLDAGLPCDDARLIPAGWWTDPGLDAAHHIVDSGISFDGVVCATDSIALGLIRGFADRGVHVPDDALVIGFDGISVGRWTVPSISTVEVDMTDLVHKAMNMLVSRIEGTYDGEPRRQTASFRLLERESTR